MSVGCVFRSFSAVSRVSRVPQRYATSVLSPLEQKYFPHIGNREIVGFGRSGTLNYMDDINCPYPPIRFQNHTDEIAALRKKEEGPWSNLTLDEVKTLYRHSFCRTLEEAIAPHGLWKLGVGWGLAVVSVGCLLYVFVRTVVANIPVNVLQLPEYKEAVKYKKIFSRGGTMTELMQFDVETKRFRE
ncbi:hypothetical protein EG68_06529 [Paragonimus skrjabini miyazakii]|uniref:Cytochrome c oxidase subunit 4 n=1 Tax=Paragonimus skrjabini miyazakii TaxID=59628 RepID=A0A8S9YYI1_9TREM|nr:hypothetical protein EG68_06529 [Paragonimus skrjabini miyazakii]